MCLIALALIGFVASVIAAFYYLRLIKIMYFDEPAVVLASEGSAVNGAMIAACASIVTSLVGSLAPAIKAIRLQPALALR